ncbi:Dyp-type peroxidase [Oerskovia sp. KBS0722]|uniref:Dyp-type peroxidase n=1 Tax=Oerskovia sp. KBS0722 TaxID=1179673 RepID=UPI00110ED54C|nr:Dyp-type peroxidase [Oerskovia sp. KBS0722]QDW61533.1 Dyp-type peroxidase [Oerskovia sp. KBS0722]
MADVGPRPEAVPAAGSAAAPSRPRVSRRAFLVGGAAAGAVAVAGAGGAWAGRATAPGTGAAPSGTGEPSLHGDLRVPFHGPRQAGVETPAQAYLTLVALTLAPGTDRDALVRLMRIWTDDVARLTQGRPGLTDTEPELAEVPARLTVTVGYGPAVFTAAGLDDRRPAWLGPLPAFAVDRLEDRWNDGDLVLQVCADDEVTVSHAVRMLLREARDFASVRWLQKGFRRSVGSEPAGRTMRNLMGQIDGTRNVDPVADAPLVWSDGTDGWLAGGTSMVVRRIRMELDTWDEVDRSTREAVMGRRLVDGAPLTGEKEHDEPDLEAVGPHGLTVIGPAAHVRRARTSDPAERFLRRAYSYDDAPDVAADPGALSSSGLVFVTFQADVDRQFVPIQRRLDEVDLLNEWTTPIGSAVFAVPPGCAEGEFLGQALLG